MRRRLGVYFLALSFILVVTAKVPAEEPTFTIIDVPGALGTIVGDINSRGDIVGKYCLEPSCIQDFFGPGWHGFLLSRGEVTSIDFPGAFHTIATGINARRDIVGWYRDVVGGPFHSFLLSGGEFTPIDFPGAFTTRAYGITPGGETIVGDYCTDPGCIRPAAGHWHGFLLRGGDFTSFDFPGALFTQVWRINPKGEIVGRYKGTDGRFHMFLLDNGDFTSIDFPGAFNTGGDAGGINPRGDIVGSYCNTPGCRPAFDKGHGFLLRDGQFTSFDFPDSVATTAHAINARGDIVGVSAFKEAPTVPHAYLRSSGEGR